MLPNFQKEKHTDDFQDKRNPSCLNCVELRSGYYYYPLVPALFWKPIDGLLSKLRGSKRSVPELKLFSGRKRKQQKTGSGFQPRSGLYFLKLPKKGVEKMSGFNRQENNGDSFTSGGQVHIPPGGSAGGSFFKGDHCPQLF